MPSPAVALTLLSFLSFTCPAKATAVPLLHLDTEVNAASVDVLRVALVAAAMMNPPAIVLEINSPGGEVESGFSLAKAIEASPVPVICVVDKTAASMASYILESCAVRLMTKRSMIMFHEPAMGGEFSGQQTRWRSIADWLNAETLAMAEHLCRRSTVKPAELIERVRGGAMWWMSWEEAKRNGFVDGVVDSTDEVLRAFERK